MNLSLLLDAEHKFKKAKEYLVQLWENRSGPLHEIEIREYKEKRNNNQNALMWAILTDISKQIQPNGIEHSPETWHEYFKATLLGRYQIEVDGKEVWISKSTTKLNVSEFADYVTQVQAWAVDHGVKFYEQLKAD